MGGREAQNKAPGGLIRNKKKYLKRERVKNRYEERTLQRKFYRQLIFKWDETDLLEIFNLPKLIKKKKRYLDKPTAMEEFFLSCYRTIHFKNICLHYMATISTVAEKVKRKITGHSFYKASINLIAKLGKESIQTEPQNYIT